MMSFPEDIDFARLILDRITSHSISLLMWGSLVVWPVLSSSQLGP